VQKHGFLGCVDLGDDLLHHDGLLGVQSERFVGKKLFPFVGVAAHGDLGEFDETFFF